MKTRKNRVGRPSVPDEVRHRKIGFSISKKLEDEAKAKAQDMEVSFSSFVSMALKAELDRRKVTDRAPAPAPMVMPKRPGNHAETPSKVIELPYYGTIAAGKPGGPLDVDDETMQAPLPATGTYKPSTHYILRVNGKSMEPEYRHGSHIVCRKLRNGEYAQKGQDVIASDGSGATFKRLLYAKDGPPVPGTPRKVKPRLTSINPKFPEVTPVSDSPIVAVVVAKF